MNRRGLARYRAVADLSAGVSAAATRPPDPVYYSQLAWKHKRVVAAAVVVCAGAAGLFSARQPKVYKATARVEVLTVRDSAPLARLDGGGAAAGYPDENYVQTQVELLRSRALFARVMAKENPGKSMSSREITEEWRKLDVRANRLSRMIDITYASPDPRAAAETANELATEFIEQTREDRWAAASKTAEWLKGKLNDLRTELSRAQDRVQRYASTANLIYSGERTTISTERLRELQHELAAAQSQMMSHAARYEVAATAAPDTVPDVLDDAALRDYQSKLAELRRQEAELSALFTPEHYKVARMRAQIAELQNQQETQRARILARLKLEYQAARRKVEALSNEFSAQTKAIHSEELSGIQYELLRRDAEGKRQLYDSLLQKIGEASLVSAIRPNDIRIVDPAEPPTSPTSPRKKLALFFGVAGGLLLGCVLAIGIEARDTSIKTPGEGAAVLRLPELASIPMIEHDPICASGKSAPATTSPAGILDLRRTDALPDLLRWHSQPSLFGESFRSAALSLMFANGDQPGPPPQVIVTSSALPREGKSVFSVNLAIALAKLGRRTLLIDGDTRRPKLHHLFGLAGMPGLTELLKGDEDPQELSVDRLGYPTAVGNLTVLPNDRSDPSASDALASERMASLVTRCRREFDTIIIDSPPVLLIADARALARLSDGVVLLVRARETSRDAALKAAQRFAQDGTPILGTVLNRWTLKSADVSSYYQYYEL